MRVRGRPWLPALAGALLCAATGCGRSPGTAAPPTAAPAGAVRIVVKDFMFTPASLTVHAGSTVTWVNEDDEPHSVRSDTGVFRSGALDTHETFSFKFDKAGTYHFTCSVHPRMVGTIMVQ